MVAAANPDEGARRGLDRVIYLMDPHDPTSMLPDSVALKRECVVTETTFLATYVAAAEWYALQWCTTSAEEGDAPHPSLARYFLPQALVHRVMPRSQSGIKHQTIALVAHDTKKKTMLEFAGRHYPLLATFASRLATGTTGTLLNGEMPKRLADVWEELAEEVAAFEQAGRVPKRLSRAMDDKKQLQAVLHQLREKLAGWRWVDAQPSGPRGGDIQIAEIVRQGQCQKLVFFEDPFVSREHEADIQLLERTTRIPGREAMCLHDQRSAAEWADNWALCIAKGIDNPVTLFQAYRLLWGVELVLADLGREAPGSGAEQGLIWRDIVDKAAWYLYGLLAQRGHERLADGEQARVAVTWGHEMHEVIEALSNIPEQLAKLDSSHPELCRPLADEHFRVPRNVLVLPTVGIMGTTDPRNEANHNANRLSSLFSGEAMSLPHYAVYEERYRQEAEEAINQKITEHWERLDIAILTCDHLREYFSSAAAAPIPSLLRSQMEKEAVGEIGGMYLTRSGAEATLKHYRRVGMSHRQFQRAAKGGGAILIAGVQPRRMEPALAALRGGLVSVLVTDLNFAWQVLRAHAEELR